MRTIERSIGVSLIAAAFLWVAPITTNSEELPARGPIPFVVYDKDKSGFVSEDEFKQVRAERIKMRAAEGRPLMGVSNAPTFAEFDVDNNGQLTEAELTEGQKAQMQKRRAEGKGGMMGQGRGQGKGMGRNRPTFADYDLNGDGAIIEDEFQQARAARIKARAEKGYPMRNLGNAPAFADVDTDKDGLIDFDEFAEHQNKQRQKKMRQ